MIAARVVSASHARRVCPFGRSISTPPNVCAELEQLFGGVERGPVQAKSDSAYRITVRSAADRPVVRRGGDARRAAEGLVPPAWHARSERKDEVLADGQHVLGRLSVV